MTQQEDIQNAVEVLRKGGVILYPTDTIWGIGCDAANDAAVRRVYDIKRRSDSKSLIVLVDSANRLQRYVRNVPDVAWQLLDALNEDEPEASKSRRFEASKPRSPEVSKFRNLEVSKPRSHQSPLTLILDNAVNLAPNLIADDGSIGIRVTNEPFSRQLCYRFQRAIVSTSANFSGEPSPRTFADIPEELKSLVDYVCVSRQRENKPAQPSRILKLSADGIVTIIR